MSIQIERPPRGYDTPNKMYEPLINPKIVKAEITALLNMIPQSSYVSNKRFFKVAADAYETARNVAEIDKGDSVQLSDVSHFSLQELPQNINSQDPIQIIRMFYLNMGDKRILTLSRHANTEVTLRDESEADFDKPYHQPKTTLTGGNKKQILEILLNGLDTPRKLKPLQDILPSSPIFPSQPVLFHL